MEKREGQLIIVTAVFGLVLIWIVLFQIAPFLWSRTSLWLEKRRILKDLEEKTAHLDVKPSELAPRASKKLTTPPLRKNNLPNYYLQKSQLRNEADSSALNKEAFNPLNTTAVPVSTEFSHSKKKSNSSSRKERTIPDIVSVAPSSHASITRGAESLLRTCSQQDSEYEECLRKDEEAEDRRLRREKKISEFQRKFETDEPKENDENSVTICFRIKPPLYSEQTDSANISTSLQRVQFHKIKRRFRRSALIEDLLDYIESLELRKNRTEVSFELFCVSPATVRFGRTTLNSFDPRQSSSLEQLGITKNTVFWVTFDD